MAQTLQAGAVVTGKQHSYRLDRELGRGGFGVTFLAQREHDGLRVALKSLHIGRLSEWKSLELFQREIDVLRRLSHPNIPAYVDDFRLGDDPSAPDGLVLVQEFVDGAPLSDVVRGGRPMNEGQVIAWFVQMLEILDYLHHLSPPVIHRDITPKNVLVREDGVAFLVDFGSVQAALRSASTVASTSAGTFGYAPMEQFVSAAFPASDLYGLAMTCLAVGSGREPSDMPFSGVRVDVRALVDYDARLMLLLERMTEPDPDRRLGEARVALEQLRPVAMRLAPTGDVASPAMQRVAEVYRAEHKATRAEVSDDDLLPSERCREAARRIELLAGRAMTLPPLASELDDFDSASISASGAMLGADNFVIDVQHMSVIAALPGEQRILSMTPSGDVIVAYDEGGWRRERLTVFKRSGDGYAIDQTIKTEDTSFTGDGMVAISPDGGSLARIGDGDLHLYDLRQGGLAQRIKGSFETVSFRSDGQVIACWDDDNDVIRLLYADGRDVQMSNARGFAFGPDGRTAAVLGDRSIRFGGLDELTSGRGAVVRVDGYSWRRPCFSPDGHWFAVLNYSSDQLVIIDVHARQSALTLTDPARPSGRIRSVQSIGFSADSGRLLVACDTFYNRFCNGDEDCVAVWAIPTGRYLGAVLRLDDDGGPIAVAASGYYGALERVGKASRNRYVRGPSETPWNRPDVAQRAVCGERIDELLDQVARAQLADVEERWAYFQDQLAAGALDPDADLLAMIDATNGLTHVLDMVRRKARDAHSQSRTFGGGQREAVALTGDQIINAAAQLAQRPPDELSLLHQELVAESERAERARAQELAKHPPRRPLAPAKRATLAHTKPSDNSRAMIIVVMIIGLIAIPLVIGWLMVM